MRNLVRNKKKKGFTLIEMVAVVAIIGILAAILVPKITGYLNEAKKTAVIDQARKVAQAYETAEMKGTLKIGNTTNNIKKTDIVTLALNDSSNSGNTTMKSLVDNADLRNIGIVLTKGAAASDQHGSGKELTIEDCLAITKGSDFEVVEKAIGSDKVQMVVTDSIDTSYASK